MTNAYRLDLLDDEEGFSDEELTDSAPRCTEAANADALVKAHGAGFRFVVEWDKWIAWNGKRWTGAGAALRVFRAALMTARAEFASCKVRMREIEEEQRVARLAGNKDRVEELEASLRVHRALLKWHEGSQNAGRIASTITVARSLLSIHVEELDSCPWYFNVSNGTVDLRSAELLPHTREHFITQVAEIEWDEASTCPTWDAFVLHAMRGDRHMVLYLARLVGYALTALSREHVLLFFWGAGSNGKSTFLRTIQSLFGEYGCAAPRDLLFQPRGGAQPHPSELARLYGKRLAVCAEVGDGHRFDEAKVKDLTGGDVISCRRMNEDWWEYKPTHTLFLAGQHKPIVQGSDFGIWRRIRLIPWTVTVTGAEVDAELPEKLARELPGILRWAVSGCLEWQRLGLEEPAGVQAATAAYRDESDVLGQFLKDLCMLEQDARVSVQDVRETYERWCRENGHEPLGGRRLDARLIDAGCSRGTVREGQRTKRGWRGIRLRTEAELYLTAEPVSDAVQS